VEVLGPSEGLHDAWMQLFVFEGEVRVNMRDQILRYDRELHRFSTDTALLGRIPALAGALGRPASDALGRLWITKPDKVLMVDPRSQPASELAATIPKGLRPLYFTPQSDGVMWMNEPGRLARFDPALPAPEAPPLRARITRVELPSSGLVLFPADGRIPALPATISTIVIHYLSPGQPFGRSVGFEVQLSGADGGWVSTGGTGSITFNHLDPGGYQVHVRPLLGRQTGEEARLDFSILAPWYRTRLAYFVFSIGVLGALNTVIWLGVYLSRREQMRLERLVSIRTGELERQIQETTEKAAALRASEEHFRRLSDNAPDIIYRVRVVPDVGYDYVSPAVISIAGYSPEEFLVDPGFTNKITQPPGAETIYDDALARRVPNPVRETRWKTRDGRVVTLEERLTPVFDATGDLMAIEGIIRDFTQRKLLEEQLRQAQRMEAVGQLAGGVAHDYNNILTSTMMQLGLLLSDPNLSDEVRDSLGQLVNDAERAAGLTRQLLMFSRRQVIQVKQIDLNEVLGNLLKMLRRLLGETIQLEFRGSPQPLWIKADAGMIEQIVTNLCVNARDAMAPKGGRLAIDARLASVGAEAAPMGAEARPGVFVCLSVIDTGCGMDAEMLKHIFEPFFTTKEVGKGTGLGLATVYGITKQHGGWVDVVSELGRGSTFRVYLPALTGVVPTDARLAEAEICKGTEAILLVEDDQGVRDMVVRGLQRHGYRVFVAANGQQAEEIWNRHAAEIDLLFTDIRMPGGMSGLELYERFKQSKPSLPVVISSGYSEEIIKLGMSVNPLLVFLPKPYDVKTLAETVRRCLDRA
jgi:PAS domain S-box-containing protein